MVFVAFDYNTQSAQQRRRRRRTVLTVNRLSRVVEEFLSAFFTPGFAVFAEVVTVDIVASVRPSDGDNADLSVVIVGSGGVGGLRAAASAARIASSAA